MTSGVTVIAILLLLVWIFRSTVAGHLARITVVAATVLIFNEALLGALLVLLRLTADNRSPARAVYLSLHLANTLLLLGALALCRALSLAWRGLPSAHGTFYATATGCHRAGGHPAGGSERNAGRAQRYALPCQLAFAPRWRRTSRSGSSWLQRLRFLHPVTAVIAGLFICWLLLRGVPSPRGTQAGDWSAVAAGPAVCAWGCGRGAAGSPVAADYSSAGRGSSVDHIGGAGGQGLRCPQDTSRG